MTVIDSAERLRRARTAFDRAAESPAEQWPTILAEECDGDVALQDEVMQMLRTIDPDPFHLDKPHFAGIDAEDDVGDERIGETIGRYTLVRMIGRGGMGSVYEALRSDDVFQQHVAVKLLRTELSGDGAKRFRRERQILANLVHRNIARLIDGGATAHGEPFLVMEFLDGVPITTYADAHALELEQRIRLFLQACAAVQYAHEQLVLHRDVKPGNILVTPDGSVKLLDFGVATLLRDPFDVRTDAPTDAGVHSSTPEYASPEQLRDEPVRVASDVYSLGVVLYELLTGSRPFELTTRSTYAALRALEQEIPRASAAATASTAASSGESNQSRLRARLTGELDNIIAKAIHRDAARRYGSVEALANDLRNYLDGKPVMAQPDSLLYRARKIVRRNRLAVLTATIAAIAMIAGTAASLVQARRADIARDVAEHESAFLQHVLSAPNNSFYRAGRQDVRVSELLDEAAMQTDTAFRGEPVVEATMRRTLGQTYTSLGRYPESERQLRAAFAIDQRVSPAYPNQAGDLQAFAELRIVMSDFAGAARAAGAAWSRCRAARADTALVCFNAINSVGVANLQGGNPRAAEQAFRIAAVIAKARFRPDDPAGGLPLGNLASAAYQRGDLRAADSIYAELIAFHSRIAATHGSSPQYAMSLLNLSTDKLVEGALTESESLATRSRAVAKRASGPVDVIVAMTWRNAAQAARRSGRLASADSALANATEVARRFPANHTAIASIDEERARLFLAEGHAADAEAAIDHALSIWANATRRLGDPRVAHASITRAMVLRAMGRAAEAQPSVVESARVLRDQYGPGHPWSIEADSLLHS